MTDTKVSIRFFEDREVRAIWDDENSKWWFSVLDVVGVLNQQDDYEKSRNYWKYLKTKLKKENNEEGVSKLICPLFVFKNQRKRNQKSPDFLKLGLCVFIKILYLYRNQILNGCKFTL